MADLRKHFDDPDYYKKIRSKRKTKPEGTFQRLNEEERKALSKRALKARWGNKDGKEQVE